MYQMFNIIQSKIVIIVSNMIHKTYNNLKTEDAYTHLSQKTQKYNNLSPWKDSEASHHPEKDQIIESV